MKRKLRAPIAALAFLLTPLLLAGCSDAPKQDFTDQPVEQIYNVAVDAMLDREWGRAANAFDEVDRQFPYSVWATKAQLMSAYVNYESNKFDDAIGAAERFIQLHPGNRDAAYAFYIKALSYYEQIVDVGRDQHDTEDALKALTDVVNRYPDTRYARDARLKIDLTRDHLAGKEMEIGRYYQQRGYYLGAISRYRKVVDDYQTTTHVPEALARLVECYTAIGLSDEATKNAAVLGYNYPDSVWYQDSYDLLKGERQAIDRGWWRRQVDWLL